MIDIFLEGNAKISIVKQIEAEFNVIIQKVGSAEPKTRRMIVVWAGWSLFYLYDS